MTDEMWREREKVEVETKGSKRTRSTNPDRMGCGGSPFGRIRKSLLAASVSLKGSVSNCHESSPEHPEPKHLCGRGSGILCVGLDLTKDEELNFEACSHMVGE